MKTAYWLTGLAAFLFVLAQPSGAAAPLAGTQAPGFYRMMLGDFEVTALNDGVISYPTARVLPTATPEQIRKGLADNGLIDPVEMSYNAYLINTGRKLILTDTGSGGKLDDQPEFHGAGHLITNLRASGYIPDQIDEVYITHARTRHSDPGDSRTHPGAHILHCRQSRPDLDRDGRPGAHGRDAVCISIARELV